MRYDDWYERLAIACLIGFGLVLVGYAAGVNFLQGDVGAALAVGSLGTALLLSM